MSNSLWPHGLQHTRPPCPSLSPRVCPSSCPLNQWCHPTISSSIAPFSSYPQSFPASGSFPVSWHFTSSGQGIGTSVSVLPMSIQGWFPLGFTGLISLLSTARQWPHHNRQTGYRALISACSMWTRLFCWNWFINRDVLIPWLFLKFHEVLQPE